QDQIRSWWATWPTANPAIAVPEGFGVVDVDPRNGGDLARLPELPATKIAMTGRGDGGVHIWFRLPDDMTLPGKLRDFGPGIDVKNGGRGYVIAPGAIHPETGGEYRWISDAPIAEAPPWLMKYAYPRGSLDPAQVAR